MLTTSPSVLTVSIVLFHSALEHLRATLLTLIRSVETARAGGLLAECDILLRDHSGDSAYAAGVERLLADLGLTEAVTLAYSAIHENRGFGAGHNAALHEARGEYVLVLNPDVEMAEDALARGLAVLEADAGTVLVSPCGTDEQGRPLHLAKAYPPVLALMLRALLPSRLGRSQAKHPGGLLERYLARYELHDVHSAGKVSAIPLASGCCMLMRRRNFVAVSGFDERYFLYFEDFDLSLRLAAGGELVYCPAMRIVHHGGRAGSKGFRHILLFAGSALRFYRDHGWRWF